MKNVKKDVNAEGTEEFCRSREGRIEEDNLITEMFSNMHLGGIRPIFDVFPPNNKLRKSCSGNPSFRLCLARFQSDFEILGRMQLLYKRLPTIKTRSRGS